MRDHIARSSRKSEIRFGDGGQKKARILMLSFRRSSSGAAAGEALAISIPRGETAVIRHFQER